MTEWSISHEAKKCIVAKDVIALLLGEAVSTKKNISLQRIRLACF